MKLFQLDRILENFPPRFHFLLLDRHQRILHLLSYHVDLLMVLESGFLPANRSRQDFMFDTIFTRRQILELLLVNFASGEVVFAVDQVLAGLVHPFELRIVVSHRGALENIRRRCEMISNVCLLV